MNKPLLIAHRGDVIHFTGNTVEAFESAFSKGADGVELDVQLSHGKLIVVHDYLFDPQRGYPTLQAVLNTFAQRGRLEIEVKSFSTEIIAPLGELLAEYTGADIELTTCELPMVSHLSEAFPNRPVGAIFDAGQFREWMTEAFLIREITELMALMGATVAHIASLPIDKLTHHVVDALHAKGMKVHYHIYKTPIEEQVSLYGRLQRLGVDQCTVDDIDLIAALAR